MNEVKWAMVAAIAGSVAAFAASVQSYVSWRGRNDQLNAAVLSAASNKCANVVTAGERYISSITAAQTVFKRYDVGTTTAQIKALDAEVSKLERETSKPADNIKRVRQEVELLKAKNDEAKKLLDPLETAITSNSEEFIRANDAWGFFLVTIRPDLEPPVRRAGHEFSVTVEEIENAKNTGDNERIEIAIDQAINEVSNFHQVIEESCVRMLRSM